MTEVDEWNEVLPAIEDAKRLWIELALERAEGDQPIAAAAIQQNRPFFQMGVIEDAISNRMKEFQDILELLYITSVAGVEHPFCPCVHCHETPP